MNSIYRLLAAALIIAAILSSHTSDAKELSYRIKFLNTSDSELSNVPVTFGHPFLRGDIPAGNTLGGVIVGPGTPIDLQVDKESTHKDGSLRHAVFSAVIPSIGAGRQVVIELLPQDTPLSGAAVTRQSLVESGQSVEVSLQIEGQTYKATLQEALQDPVDQWLDGPLTSEWITDVPFKRTSDAEEHSDLKARFYVRKYIGTNNVKVDVVVENLTTFVGIRDRFDYAAEIRINGSVVYSKSDITHFPNTRWKYTFWTQGQPSIHVTFDPATLMQTAAIPAYYPSLIGDMTDQSDYSGFAGSEYVSHSGTMIDRYGPMGRGLASSYMPGTGARRDIGPMPGWCVDWLTTQTQDATLMLIRSSDLAGSWGIHFRDENTGLPVTIDTAYGGYPEWATQDRFNPNPGPVSAVSGSGSPMTPDHSHQPQSNFLPYLVTGDFFHFEELEFWAAWNMGDADPGSVKPLEEAASGYRGHDRGHIINIWSPRSHAWSLRTLVLIAAFSPDDHYTKPYWEQLLDNNRELFPYAYMARSNIGVGSYKPWMDDYVTFAVTLAVDQGYENWRTAAEWKAGWTVSRMGQGPLGGVWCWQAGTDYKFGPSFEAGFTHTTVDDYWAAAYPAAQGLTCNTQAMADALGLDGPGRMLGRDNKPGSYVAQMGLALTGAVNIGVEGAQEAWDIYSGATGERTVFPDYRGEAQDATVPRDYLPEKTVRPVPPVILVQ